MNDQLNPVIEKVRKLLALANSPNQAEAMAAAAKAHELLASYNLTMADAIRDSEQSDALEEEVFEEGRCSKKWRAALLFGICKVSFCRSIHEIGPNGSYKFTVIGRESCVIGARILYEYLESAVGRVCARECRGMRTAPRDKFRMGMVLTINQRLIDQFNCIGQDNQERALVLWDAEAVEKRLQSLGVRKRPLALGRLDTKAFSAGCAAGRSVSLARQIDGATMSNPRITGGPA